METLSTSVRFFMEMAKVQAKVSRRFDNGLGGLGFTEFIMLSHLSEAGSPGIRRIDLAEKVGLTASGITRLLLPMEKIGLVKKEINKDDARSSLVMIAPGGKRKLEEGLERAELLADEIIPSGKKGKIRELSSFLTETGKRILAIRSNEVIPFPNNSLPIMPNKLNPCYVQELRSGVRLPIGSRTPLALL